MIEWTSSGGVKVERAKKHIREIEGRIADFAKRDPYQLVPGVGTEIDPETGERRQFRYWSLWIYKEPPLEIGAIAGDAVHNLRAALDILWRNVWYPRGRDPAKKSREFPISESADGLKDAYPLSDFAHKPRLKRIVDLLYEIKPYKGGNDLLWMLREADDLDKHRLLIPIYGGVGLVLLNVTRRNKMSHLPYTYSVSVYEGQPTTPVKDGTVLLSHADDDTLQVDMNPETPLLVTFGEPEILHDKPMVPTLNQMAGMVDGIAETFIIAGLML